MSRVRTSVLITLAIGLALCAGLCGAHTMMGAGALILTIPLGVLASRSITAPLTRLTAQVYQIGRAGGVEPVFPVNSPVPQLNTLASALNGVSQSIRRSRTDLDNAYVQFVETMAQVLEARDPYTGGHSLRVSAYAHAIACEMGVPADEREIIRVAARLHDLGKIGIPDAVLQKPGPLTPEEEGLIKLHPQIGRRMLEKIERFRELLDVVELHHENHDGSGYPYMLSGDRIPVSARIVHIADAFDAMTTNRSYRDALPLRAALDELRIHMGSQFDPVVTEVFLRLIAEGRPGHAIPEVEHPAPAPVSVRSPPLPVY